MASELLKELLTLQLLKFELIHGPNRPCHPNYDPCPCHNHPRLRDRLRKQMWRNS
jgi:hypothetical protein